MVSLSPESAFNDTWLSFGLGLGRVDHPVEQEIVEQMLPHVGKEQRTLDQELPHIETAQGTIDQMLPPSGTERGTMDQMLPHIGPEQ